MRPPSGVRERSPLAVCLDLRQGIEEALAPRRRSPPNHRRAAARHRSVFRLTGTQPLRFHAKTHGRLRQIGRGGFHRSALEQRLQVAAIVPSHIEIERRRDHPVRYLVDALGGCARRSAATALQPQSPRGRGTFRPGRHRLQDTARPSRRATAHEEHRGISLRDCPRETRRGHRAQCRRTPRRCALSRSLASGSQAPRPSPGGFTIGAAPGEAKVVQSDIRCSNGVIHKVADVLVR